MKKYLILIWLKDLKRGFRAKDYASRLTVGAYFSDIYLNLIDYGVLQIWKSEISQWRSKGKILLMEAKTEKSIDEVREVFVSNKDREVWIKEV